MGALTVNAADQAKGSHRLHSQSRTGQVTTRLANNPNSSSIPTNSVPVKLDILGSIGDFISKVIPWVLAGLGGLVAIGLAVGAHKQNAQRVDESISSAKQSLFKSLNKGALAESFQKLSITTSEELEKHLKDGLCGTEAE